MPPSTTRLGGGLDQGAGAAPAGVLRPDGAQHAHDGRDHIQRFGDVLTDPVHRPGAAQARGAFRLDGRLQARQMPGQRPDVTVRWTARRPFGSTGSPIGVVVGGRSRFTSKVAEVEDALFGVDHRRLLRLRPEDQRRQRRHPRLQRRVPGHQIADDPGQFGGVCGERVGRLDHALEYTAEMRQNPGVSTFLPHPTGRFDRRRRGRAPLQSIEQQRKLNRAQTNRAVPDRRPGKSSVLQPLRCEDHPGAVPDQELEPILRSRDIVHPSLQIPGKLMMSSR
ncbi:hypothetical protein FHS63_004536 [Azospirillum doebereinerae]